MNILDAIMMKILQHYQLIKDIIIQLKHVMNFVIIINIFHYKMDQIVFVVMILKKQQNMEYL